MAGHIHRNDEVCTVSEQSHSIILLTDILQTSFFHHRSLSIITFHTFIIVCTLFHTLSLVMIILDPFLSLFTISSHYFVNVRAHTLGDPVCTLKRQLARTPDPTWPTHPRTFPQQHQVWPITRRKETLLPT